MTKFRQRTKRRYRGSEIVKKPVVRFRDKSGVRKAVQTYNMLGDRFVDLNEIERLIRANVDKTVAVVDVDGEIQNLFVHSVDEEGFVCDIAAEMTQPPACAYWVRFADIREVHPARGESKLEISSFTVEFLEHLSPQNWQQWLTLLANTGASVERKSDRVYVVACSRTQQLAHVGWLLFHSHLRDICRVVSTSGEAETRTSAYPKPQQSE